MGAARRHPDAKPCNVTSRHPPQSVIRNKSLADTLGAQYLYDRDTNTLAGPVVKGMRPFPFELVERDKRPSTTAQRRSLGRVAGENGLYSLPTPTWSTTPDVPHPYPSPLSPCSFPRCVLLQLAPIVTWLAPSHAHRSSPTRADCCIVVSSSGSVRCRIPCRHLRIRRPPATRVIPRRDGTPSSGSPRRLLRSPSQARCI